MKTRWFLAVLVAASPLILAGLYGWDSSRNHGLELGYFGDFNRVRHALARIPGVVITHEWSNRDVTLEEFGFDLSVGGERAVHLNILESDPVRHLSGDSLAQALATRLQSGASAPTAPR